MSQPLVIAYHLIWTAYGWWLPNDPRGSGSHIIRNPVLQRLGELHHGRKTVQPPGADVRVFYEEAHALLKHHVSRFTRQEMMIISDVFARVMRDRKYTCYACAIMPDHVHILIRKHRDLAEEMIEHLQSQSRLRLSATARRPADHPIWSRGGWKVFLDHPDEIRRTIAYINDNPRWMSLPDQCWSFVTKYDGWPLHPGHSPNSPYVKALRAAGRYPPER